MFIVKSTNFTTNPIFKLSGVALYYLIDISKIKTFYFMMNLDVDVNRAV